MKKILIIILHELKILIKDRQALALLFVMPLALIVFLTFALQDVYQSKVGRKMVLNVVTHEACDTVDTACGLLVSKIQRFNYNIVLSKEIESQKKIELALILPTDIENTIKNLQKQKSLKPEEQVQILFDPMLDQSSRALVEGHLMLSLQGILIERLHKKIKNTPVKLTLTDVSKFEGLVVQKALGGVVLPNPIQQTVPAWALFGMFFIVIPLTNSMIRDRRLGVFKRLLSFPVSKFHLIIGKIVPFLFINILQFLIMFAVGVFILPKLTNLNLVLDFNLWNVFLVTIVCAMAATSYGLLVSCFAQTSEQAHAFGAFSIVILAILGGVMIPRFVMPEFMQNLSIISPLYWGLDSYLDLMVRKLPLQAIVPKLFLLSTFSVIAAVISSLRFRWSEES